MNTAPRNLPRYLPTLTEVVQAPGLAPAAVAAVPPDLEATVQSVLQRVEPVLEARLREEVDAMVRALMTEQLPSLRLRLREELMTATRQAVAEALAPAADLHKTK